MSIVCLGKAQLNVFMLLTELSIKQDLKCVEYNPNAEVLYLSMDILARVSLCISYDPEVIQVSCKNLAHFRLKIGSPADTGFPYIVVHGV